MASMSRAERVLGCCIVWSALSVFAGGSRAELIDSSQRAQAAGDATGVSAVLSDPGVFQWFADTVVRPPVTLSARAEAVAYLSDANSPM